MEITYELLKPLIVKEELEGNQVKIEFKAENQEQPIETIGVIMPSQDEIMKNVAKQAIKQGVKSAAINTAANALGNLVGGGAGNLLGSTAKSVGNDAAFSNQDPMAMLKTDITPEKQQTAVVNAFAALQNFYNYNEQTQKWEYVPPKFD